MNSAATGCGEFVSYLVRRGPVFVLLGLCAQFEHHIDDLAEGVLPSGGVVALLASQSEDVEDEDALHVGNLLYVLCREL